jgi:glycerophosphoryl diester phosphodiesterase
VSSFRFETVDRCRSVLPTVRTAVLTQSPSVALLDRTAAAGHDAIHPSVAVVDADYVRAAHSLGLAVNVWTCNDRDRMRLLVDWGVDGICTDVPDVAIEVCRGAASSV